MDVTLPELSDNNTLTAISQLERKIKELEKQNQELESFAYIASHDLQEPLRKIHIFTQRIMESEQNNFSETTTDHFNRILSATARMKKLIDALLNYSRTNTDDKVFVKQNLNKLLDEVKQDLNETILEKNAVITSDSLPIINVIPHQFAQLLENLISNSLKYSRQEEPPIIEIKATRIAGIDNPNLPNPHDEYWHLSVKDNGIGFAEEYSERIFELFQRLHGKHEYEGTGIGLAVCKKIVQNHGGIINAVGAAGKGCTINIYLPVSITIQ